MLEDAAGIRRVVLACGTVDLRKGIDGLATIIGDKYGQNPFEKGTLFLFCGKRSDRCKGLLWMGTGFLLLYKRFEAGRLSWPRSGSYRGTVQVSHDGFKSPGSQDQRCRSEKNILRCLCKTEKILFCFYTEKNCLRSQRMHEPEQFFRLLLGRNDAIAP